MDASILKCPRCGAAMESIAVGGVNLRECPRCEGLWCDVEALRTICESRDMQGAVIADARQDQMGGDEAIEAKVRYLPCPACQQLMNRVNFAGCSGVIVDVCGGHGTWFDRDELRRVAEFIQSGGMEKSRALQLEDFKEAEGRARAAQFEAALERSQTNTNRYGWFGFDIAQLLIDLLR